MEKGGEEEEEERFEGVVLAEVWEVPCLTVSRLLRLEFGAEVRREPK